MHNIIRVRIVMNIKRTRYRSTKRELSSRSDNNSHPIVQFLRIRSLEDIRVIRRKNRKGEPMLIISYVKTVNRGRTPSKASTSGEGVMLALVRLII
jgi:hypothetical protein